MEAGLPAQSHSETCRRRVEEYLEQSREGRERMGRHEQRKARCDNVRPGTKQVEPRGKEENAAENKEAEVGRDAGTDGQQHEDGNDQRGSEGNRNEENKPGN